MIHFYQNYTQNKPIRDEGLVNLVPVNTGSSTTLHTVQQFLPKSDYLVFPTSHNGDSEFSERVEERSYGFRVTKTRRVSGQKRGLDHCKKYQEEEEEVENRKFVVLHFNNTL